MSKRIRVVLVATVLVLVGSTVFLWLALEEAPSPRFGPRLHFGAGQRWAYALDWQAKTSGQIAGGEGATLVGLESHLAGELLVEVVSARPDGALVALSLSRLDHFEFVMQGRAATPDLSAARASLVAQPAFVELDGRGQVKSLSFVPGASPALRATLRSLALELNFTLPQQDAQDWEAIEPTAQGSLSARYQGSATRLLRTPLRYLALDVAPGPLTGLQEVFGSAAIEVDEAGVLRSIEDVQQVRYHRPGQPAAALDASWNFQLHRTPGTPPGAQATLPPNLSPQPLQGQLGDEGLLGRRDARQASAITPELLALTIENYERGSKPGNSFLVSAGAFLRLHPEALADLLLQFSSKELTVKGRGLVLDVLAEAGDPAAQTAMREALTAAAAHASSENYSQLAQRFSFVRNPTAASVEFLATQTQQARQQGDLKGAQGPLVALGSSVRRLQERGEGALAQVANTRLLAEVEAVKDGTPLQKRGALAALGNAARAQNVETIIGFAQDSEPLVRDQVASALRTVDCPRARETLLTLASDGSTAISISAFDSLRTQTLTPQDWAGLAQLARSGRTPASADGTLVGLVRERREEAGSSGRDILLALQQRNRGGDNDLALIIEAMLAEG